MPALVDLMQEFYAESNYSLDRGWATASFRRHGIGAALVAAAFAEGRARGVAAMEVEVGTDNAAASKLYASFGLMPNDAGRRRLAARMQPVQ